MIVPKWFLKELRLIDPTYAVKDTEDHDGCFIVKDVDLSFKADDGKTLSIPGGKSETLRARGQLEVLYVPNGHLGQATLEKLKELKLKGLELGIFDNPVNELAYYQKLRKEAKQKKQDNAVDMISEGLMEMHRLERKKSFSYGGSDEKP